ncbi:MAG TPA: ATP-dependent DNA helicase UvrD2 [Acidimicrobiales bacterium]|nr:ATP-dependent DNA helicase UvrD2 [Acidimicrobiales bacterium]
MDPAALLHGLTERQAEAVASPGAPLCILAGAGSGKTRVLTRRIAYRVAAGTAEARHVLALTFTRKAASELGRRLEALGVHDRVSAGTFHSVAYAQLRQWWADNGRPAPSLLERKAGMLARLQGPPSARPGTRGRAQPGDLAAEIEWAKARMIAPRDYAGEAAQAGREPPLAPDAMATIYQRYEDEKRRRGLIDFDDLLGACVAALESDERFAASQRWRYRHLFVDEFQDVNPAQARLLAGWRGDHDDLCVVGDPNQAIYSWNGADPTQLQEFQHREPGATVVVLDDNFRSSPQVLAVAGAVLAGGPGPVRVLRPRRPDGPLPQIRAFDTEDDEARGIARAVRDGHAPGSAWSHVAVLTRTNAQLVVLEQAFRTAAIPYRVRGGGAFLQRREVKAALAEMGRGADPLARGLADAAGSLRAAPAQDPDADPGGNQGEGPAAERQAALEELIRLGHDYLAHEAEATVAGFQAWLAATLRSEAPAVGSDAVELATFHAAKGLEWPVVYLAGLERGLVPITFATTEAARDEERRLLYVAVTRAERQLHCSWARQRTFGTRTSRRNPSPWLDDIEAACSALTRSQAVPGSREWRSHLARERARLRGARGAPSGARQGRVKLGAGADPQLLAALKAWRTQAAKAGGVPAFVVFHDTTLAAIAEARPRTRAALLALPGLGPVKAERYGDALLAVVSDAAEGATTSTPDRP